MYSYTVSSICVLAWLEDTWESKWNLLFEVLLSNSSAGVADVHCFWKNIEGIKLLGLVESLHVIEQTFFVTYR